MRIWIAAIALTLFTNTSYSSSISCESLFIQNNPRTQVRTESLVSRLKNIPSELSGNLRFNFDPKRFKAELTTASSISIKIQEYRQGFRNKWEQFAQTRWGGYLKTDITSFFDIGFISTLSRSDRNFLRSILFKNSSELTTQERQRIQLISQEIFRPQLHEEIVRLMDSARSKKLYIYIVSLLHSKTVPRLSANLPRSFFTNQKLGLKILAEAGVWALNPTPKYIMLYNKDVRNIYWKIKLGKSKKLYEALSKDELDTLDQLGLLEDAYLYHRSFQGESRIRSFVSTVLSKANSAFIKLPLYASFLTLMFLTPRGDFITHESFITSRLNETRPSVEVILDTTLFSHTAIRIGDKVYSPSQTTINVFHAENYFQGLRKNPIREVQTVALTLSANQIKALKADLDQVVWHRYDNNTFYYDCTTVISDYLSKNVGISIPPIINASPTLMLGYLRASKLAGNESVGSSSFVYGTEEQSKLSGILRSTLGSLEHSFEAKVFLLLSFDIMERQNEIRSKNELVFKNDIYDAHHKSTIASEKEKIKNSFEVSHYFSLLNILKIQASDRISKEEYDVAKLALRSELQDILHGVQESYHQESDATMKMHLLARTEAISEIIQELELM